jgi:hypothetical protein
MNDRYGNKARVARFELPGPRWYVAVCDHCSWAAFSWKSKDEAKYDRDVHNGHHHPEVE